MGIVCEDPTTARVSVKVNKSSRIKFTVAIRNDIPYQDLRPDQQFPINCVPLEDFALGLTTIVPGARRTMCGCPDFDSAVVHIAKRVIEFITYWFPSLPLGAKMQLFHFKKESLTKLKAIAEKSSEARLSTNDALSAFMWRCVTRVRQTGVVEMPVAASKFLFTADFAKGLIRHYQPTTSEMQFNVWLLQCQYRLCLNLLRVSWLQQLPRSKKGLIQLTPISFELQSSS